jgi:branched-chain amino acid transport system substrate-binding protein
VWVLGVDGKVVRLDERTARPRARATLPTRSPTAIAVGADAAWVTSSADGTLWRVGDGPEPSVGSVDVGPGVSDVAAAPGGVWIVNPLEGTLVKVDPATSTVTRSVSLGATPRSVAASEDTVWVAVADGAQQSATADVAGVTPLPASVCEPVVAGGGGNADLLIVSDLPLQGGTRVVATQMTQAITFALRERGFRAGRFHVAYQSCDDSIARTGLYDEAKCAANARAYGANRDVVGVIGTLNSDCALAALPALNRAPGGGLAMVSPLNSFVGLTRSGAGIDPRLPAELYPTGHRNYARVYPTDDMQGAALATFTRDRGRTRVFVLDDGEPGYGMLMADGFEAAAGRLGLDVAGRASWDPRRRRYRRLARRVERSAADAVFLGGLLDTNGARVVQDLRTRLDAGDADLLAPDGFTPVPLLFERAGAAARDLFVTPGGLVTAELPPAGARFAARFARTQAGVPVEAPAIYAAQAALVLLDAIARSDGTRASVVEQLFRTRVTDGLLGTFRLDSSGDVTEAPVAVLRVREGGTSRRILSVEGAVVERVVRPPSSLVAADD